jgi:nitroreductase
MAMLEAARWAPSVGEEEPWSCVVWDRFNNELGWQKAFECLAPGNQLWAAAAPVLILSLAATKSKRTGKVNPWAQHDAGAASENLCLQAAAMGLYAHQIGDFDRRKTARAFNVPHDLAPTTIVVVGHPGSAEHLDTTLRERELETRNRRPVDVCCFENRWGDPLQF